MSISDERLLHSIGVARKMKEIVLSNPQKYDVTPDEAFFLGFIHDIGYEFTDDQTEHSKKGGELLRKQNYKFWKEVYYHGIPQTDYDSPMLRLLNYSDMIIDNAGKQVTVEERLAGIVERYGKGSSQELDAIELIKIFNKL